MRASISYLVVFFLVFCSVNISSQKIFPGSIGFGTEFRGAYQGSDSPTILFVNTLQSGSVQTGDNSGSFEWCVTRSFPRIIVFEVSGVIDYTKAKNAYINIKTPYVNIYGQTAPANGINLLGCELYVNTHDVLIQHIKIRQYDKNPNQVLNRCLGILGGSYNVVVDHCSFAFANDEVVTIWGADRNITISNCIVAFPLNESNHTKKSKPFAHGYPIIDNANDNLSYIGNLVAFGIFRFPLTDATKSLFQNNLHFAVGKQGIAGPQIANGQNRYMEYIVRSNVFLHASEATWTHYAVGVSSNVSKSSKLWVDDNISLRSISNKSLSDWDNVMNSPGLQMPSQPPFDVSRFPLYTTAANVEAYVYENVGAFYWDRDYIDKEVIKKVKERYPNFINSPAPMPARAHKWGTKLSGGNMRYGYDFGSNNVSFAVNGKWISLKTKLTDQAQVIDALSKQLPSDIEVIAHPHKDCHYLIIQTKSAGSNQSIKIEGDASVFGIESMTYYGTDGIGGYPAFAQQNHTLNLPDNPHGDKDNNGFTNLEDWIFGDRDGSATVKDCGSFNLVGEVVDTDFDTDNGSITLTISGGTEPYNISWADGSESSNRTGLKDGTYSVNVVDAEQCAFDTSFTVNRKADPCLEFKMTKNVVNSDFNKDNGSINLTISGGEQPYVFEWSDGSGLEDRIDLKPGEYTIIVKDANLCSIEDNIVIGENEDPCLTYSVSGLAYDASSSDNDGSILLTVNNGKEPYSFVWSDGESTKDRYNLKSGEYSVIITDANDCKLNESYTVGVAIDPCANLAVSGTVTNSDYQKDNGSISIVVAGGTQPYSYLWQDGIVDMNRSSLIPGNYTVVITDENDCEISKSFEVAEKEDPCKEFALDGSVTNSDFEKSNGAIILNVTGGLGSYIYTWSDGAATKDRVDLSPGEYRVEVSDDNECVVSNVFNIIENPDPCGDFYVEGKVINSEYQENNGSIALFVSGGSGKYSYSWSDGSKIKDRNNLVPDEYSVVVSDKDICEYSGTFEVKEDPMKFKVLKYYPNPTKSNLALEYRSPTASVVEIAVIDQDGVVVLTNTMQAKIGYNKNILDVSMDSDGNTMLKGKYVVQLTNNNEIIEIRIIKK